MDFDLSEERQALRKQLEGFCQRELNEDRVAALEAASTYPQDLHQAMAAAGILGYCLPQNLGGSGGTMQDLVLINEVLGAHSASAVNIFFINMACGAILTFAGSKEQKTHYLPKLASGELKFAFALTEANAGSDAGAIRSTSRPDGDGFVINGEKLYTTGAADADFILTVVRSNDEERASRGSSLFLVPTNSDGLDIQPMDKLAGNAVASCRVLYNDLKVAPTQLVGGEHQGWGFLMMTAGVERLTIAASCVGSAQQVLASLLQHVKSREQFGQAIGRFQSVQHQLVDIATEIEAMRLLTWRAAWLADKGGAPIREICMAKLYSTERMNEIVQKGMRLMGGQAYFTDHPMQRIMRESVLGLYAGGTCEIQRNMIAKSLGL